MKEQYYFTCNCGFCINDPVQLEPALLCLNCSKPVPINSKPASHCDNICVHCRTPISAGQQEKYRKWRENAEHVLSSKVENKQVFDCFEEGVKLLKKTDFTLYKLAEETRTRALDSLNMEILVQSITIRLPIQRTFHHKHSLPMLNPLALLFKSLLALGRKEEAMKVFPEVMRIVRLNYGDNHNLYKYMMSHVN